MLRRKMCHIFRTGMPTKFKLDIRMENDDRHHRYEMANVRWTVKVVKKWKMNYKL